MSEAFYLPDGGAYVATAATRGPWDEGAQHGGPVAALVGTLFEEGREDARVTRMSLDILRPVPIAPLTVELDVVRPGRRVELVAAHVQAGGVEVARAHAWRLRADPSIGLEADVGPARLVPEADDGDNRFWHLPWDEGWHTATERRTEEGSLLENGPATVWFRPRIPIVAGSPVGPLARVLVAADAGNGISARLDIQQWMFVNTDLTVALVRPVVGEWVRVAARTRLAGDGIGLAETVLGDTDGDVGTGLQSLYVGRTKPAR